MEYQLAKKAYIAGLMDEVRFYGRPDSGAELIHVEPSKGRNAARNIFAHTHYEDYTKVRAIRAPKEDAYLFEGKSLTMSAIRQTLAHRKWRASMIALVENNPGAKVYIRSGQWGAWWRPDACGYTERLEEAGIYEIEEAWKFVSHCGLEKAISFQLIND